MEQSLSRRLEAMDRRLNGLLRKAALVAVTLAAMALALMLLPYCWPFVLAFAFSRMLEPFVRVVTKGRIRLGRKAAAALVRRNGERRTGRAPKNVRFPVFDILHLPRRKSI